MAVRRHNPTSIDEKSRSNNLGELRSLRGNYDSRCERHYTGSNYFKRVGQGRSAVNTSAHLSRAVGCLMVPGGGVEPPRYQVPADFESAASASSAIPAEEDCPAAIIS